MKQAVAHLVPFIEALKTEGTSSSKGRISSRCSDVHDIGKNIVGVVLQCNNFEVIDLGVMVPTQRILDASDENADLIGLSGLITPSLDEMVHVAAEMERQGFDVPLLIGGDDLEGAHGVKIDPVFHRNQAVYVTDASRAVGVATALTSERQKDAFVAERVAEYEDSRSQCGSS